VVALLVEDLLLEIGAAHAEVVRSLSAEDRDALETFARGEAIALVELRAEALRLPSRAPHTRCPLASRSGGVYDAGTHAKEDDHGWKQGRQRWRWRWRQAGRRRSRSPRVPPGRRASVEELNLLSEQLYKKVRKLTFEPCARCSCAWS
jgi:hypothetical protein